LSHIYDSQVTLLTTLSCTKYLVWDYWSFRTWSSILCQLDHKPHGALFQETVMLTLTATKISIYLISLSNSCDLLKSDFRKGMQINSVVKRIFSFFWLWWDELVRCTIWSYGPAEDGTGAKSSSFVKGFSVVTRLTILPRHSLQQTNTPTAIVQGYMTGAELPLNITRNYPWALSRMKLNAGAMFCSEGPEERGVGIFYLY
jgi:hypothetical protein